MGLAGSRLANNEQMESTIGLAYPERLAGVPVIGAPDERQMVWR